MAAAPYCGLPPLPQELLHRFNLDPILIGVLVCLLVCQAAMANDQRVRRHAVIGWSIAALAFLSPLCALSVSLFSARIAQHMILILAAAPLIALGLPPSSVRRQASALWFAAVLFFLALWFWHMPRPYDATFAASWIYWTMHITLFGSSILLWRQLLNHRSRALVEMLAVGALTSTQMGFLGAVLTLAAHPLFSWHFTTTYQWGLTPLQDQQLGGALMWVPGIMLFFWAAIRSLIQLGTEHNKPKPA